VFNIIFKNFIRSKGLLLGLLFLLIAGWVGLYIGKQFLNRQQDIIDKTAHFQQESIERNVRFVNKEMGLLLYYLRFALVNETPNLTALSIGQRDVNPSVQSVNIRNLEAQKYDTDLANPMHLLLGNLDFGFVLIYLFPLIIIAFMYNLISEEKDEGTWALVISQAGTAKKLLWYKFLIRYFAILGVLGLLLWSAFFTLHLSLDKPFLSIIGISILYITLWFSMSYWLISFQKNAAFNAQLLLTLWVFLTVIAPALVNRFVALKYPIPEALATVVAQRDGYHRKWDADKSETMENFYAHYPQFRVFPLPDKPFSWLWYYAMQQMGDDDAHHEATEMRTKLELREKASRQIALFLPALHTQLIMNDLCQSSMNNHLYFLDSLTRFHEQKRFYFYPKIFADAPVNGENWSKQTVEYFREKQDRAVLNIVMPLLLFIAFLIIWTWRNLANI
jgi:ABC-2 type transport system permease protein